MGAQMSVTGDTGGPQLGDIPESCIAEVLGYLDPPEICRLARLNRAFRGASSADFIWESKLPPTYFFLIQKLFKLYDNDEENGDFHELKLVLPPALLGFTKKDIFARLSSPNLFDDGSKVIWLDKNTGGVCLSISSKALSIIGIEDRRYWNRIPNEESRFLVVAFLVQIWWLEVSGSLEFKLPIGTYSLFFRLQLGKTSKRFGRRICNLENIHGWKIKPVRFKLSTSDGQQLVSQHYLDNPGSWILYHVGDFVVNDPNKLTKIEFAMSQIDCTHTKGGLSLDSVFIYPKGVT